MTTPSEQDEFYLKLGRQSLSAFIEKCASSIPMKNGRILEIGAQGRSEIAHAFNAMELKRLDLIPGEDVDYIGDITKFNNEIEDNSFDIVACLEVLEHTVQPFDAISELRRLLKDGGFLLISSPLNFRIHGPIPDCWRFTEFGWKVLLKNFDIVFLDKLESPNRPLFPIKYNILARCNKTKSVCADDLSFEKIES